jgi:hypothetical protein
MAIAVVAGRIGQVMAGNEKRVMPIRRGHAAPHILSDKGGGADRQVVARVVRSHACRSGRSRVVAPVCAKRLRVAPCSAQHRGARACGDCQRDRKDECSEHWAALSPFKGKEYARSGFLGNCRQLCKMRGNLEQARSGVCGISPPGAKNSAARAGDCVKVGERGVSPHPCPN